MGKNIIVFGAGGFIGGHLATRLADEEDTVVVGVDRKPIDEWRQRSRRVLTMPRFDAARREDFSILQNIFPGPVDEVYNLAAAVGGIGYIEQHRAECMLSVLPSTNVLLAAQEFGWNRVFYSSSACLYPKHLQRESDSLALRESDAYPADAEDGYGWEKLFSERMHRHFMEDYGIQTRVARYHNVYGTHDVWQGDRAHAPAATCRKIAVAELTGKHEISIWGDGEQTRSFMHVDDCLEGTIRLMRSNVDVPVNVGSDELVTINDLVTLVEEIAGIEVERHYQLDASQGVRGRNSDNTLIREKLDWEPSTQLVDGLIDTYEWIKWQVQESINEGSDRHV